MIHAKLEAAQVALKAIREEAVKFDDYIKPGPDRVPFMNNLIRLVNEALAEGGGEREEWRVGLPVEPGIYFWRPDAESAPQERVVAVGVGAEGSLVVVTSPDRTVYPISAFDGGVWCGPAEMRPRQPDARIVSLSAEHRAQIVCWITDDLSKMNVAPGYRQRLRAMFKEITGFDCPENGLPVMPQHWPLQMEKVLRYDMRRFAASPRPVMCYWVDSSHVACFGYDETDGVLYIEFAGRTPKKPGAKQTPPEFYRYKDVTFELFAGLLIADSKGVYLKEKIMGHAPLIPVEKLVGGKWQREWKGKR